MTHSEIHLEVMPDLILLSAWQLENEISKADLTGLFDKNTLGVWVVEQQHHLGPVITHISTKCFDAKILYILPGERSKVHKSVGWFAENKRDQLKAAMW